MSARWIVGTFDDEARLLHATRQARANAYRIDDVYTPYAVHGLSDAMGLKASRLTWVCFLMGLTGAVLALGFQVWSSSVDWPINVGGKPFDSLPAFIPIAFEITVLFAGLGVVAALFARCGLWPGARKVQPRIEITDDRFVLVLRLEGARHTVDDARAFLAEEGAVDVVDHLEELLP